MTAPKMSEADLLRAVLDLAEHCRWAVHHDRPARRSGSGWATHIAGHAGFPDLVLARRGVVLFRELKGYDARGRLGRLSPEQRDWAKQLGEGAIGHRFAEVAAGLVPVFAVWTPGDWPEIVATLTARSSLPVGAVDVPEDAPKEGKS